MFVQFQDGTTAHVNVGGPDRIIHVDGRDYTFEDHPTQGPTPLNKQGAPMRAVPRRVWLALTQWHQGGQKFGADGKAVWAEPVDETAEGLASGELVKVGRNIYQRATYERIAAKLEARKP